MIWLKSHLPFLLMCLGAWIAVAALLARWIAKPTKPRWAVIVYTVFVDAPSFVAAHNGEISGVFFQIFGIKLAIPMLSLTTVQDPKMELPPKVPPAALVLLVGASLALSGCSIASAARAGADAAALIQSAGAVVDSLDVQKDATVVAECQAAAAKPCTQARADLAAWQANRGKARAALTIARSALLGYQASLVVAQTAKNGGGVDVGAVMSGITSTVSALLDALSRLGITVSIPKTAGVL